MIWLLASTHCVQSIIVAGFLVCTPQETQAQEDEILTLLEQRNLLRDMVAQQTRVRITTSLGFS